MSNILNKDDHVLKDLYQDIFNCGKNLSLLRICEPKVQFYFFKNILFQVSYNLFLIMKAFFMQ